MHNDCRLIATLPAINRVNDVLHVFKNSHISQARFNTGSHTPMSIPETVAFLKDLSQKYEKKLWIDIKGRQLRVIKWADPLYECIELNHDVDIIYPAKIYFRNGDGVNITHVRGNKVFVDPLPKQAVGAGQSVNILAKDLEIKGYLTEKDGEYLEECNKQGMNNIMASFIEQPDDLNQIFRIVPNAKIVAKIESLKGIQFINQHPVGNLMAARDDLYMEAGQNYNMLNLLNNIIEKDPNAICASRIFSSLEKRETVDFADYSDLELMYRMGFRTFMLCDNVCNYAFDKAISAWEGFING